MSEKELSFGIKLNENVIKDKENLRLQENGEIISYESNIKNINNSPKLHSSGNSIKNKCNMLNCKKKLSLVDMSIKCKCGNIYCNSHRYSSNHDCQFNYKKDFKNILETKLDKVINDKVIKF